MNVGLSFVCVLMASSTYHAKLMKGEAEEKAKAAEKELDMMKKKITRWVLDI